jgi:hypothetical protein
MTLRGNNGDQKMLTGENNAQRLVRLPSPSARGAHVAFDICATAKLGQHDTAEIFDKSWQVVI